VAADGTILFGLYQGDLGGDNDLCAVAADGGPERWRLKTGRFVTHQPVLGADGTLYLTSLEGKLVAYRDR